MAMQVSHETIYRSLFIQARGVLKKELQGHLRSRRTMQKRLCAKGRSADTLRTTAPSTFPARSLKLRTDIAQTDVSTPGKILSTFLPG